MNVCAQIVKMFALKHNANILRSPAKIIRSLSRKLIMTKAFDANGIQRKMQKSPQIYYTSPSVRGEIIKKHVNLKNTNIFPY